MVAYVDGAGTGHNFGRYVMAGYVAFVHQWQEFADAWSSELQRYPAIPFFRMASMRNAAWRYEIGISKDQAELKTKRLGRLLQDSSLILFSAISSVSQEEFERVMTDTGLRANKDVRQAMGRLCFKTHYTYLFHSIAARVLWKLRDLEIVGDQVDFVFDREDQLFNNANVLLKNLRDRLPLEIRDMLGDASQNNDQTLVPLQAADYLAATARDYYAEPKNTKKRKRLLAASGTGHKNATLIHTEEHLRTMATALMKPRPVDLVLSNSAD